MAQNNVNRARNIFFWPEDELKEQLQSKSFKKSSAVGSFYETDSEIWAGFG